MVGVDFRSEAPCRKVCARLLRFRYFISNRKFTLLWLLTYCLYLIGEHLNGQAVRIAGGLQLVKHTFFAFISFTALLS